jgi:hypothetical protein
VPCDVGVCRLGWWNANESTLKRPVTGLDLAGPETANCGSRDAEDLADVGVAESDTRQRGQTSRRSLFGLAGVPLPRCAIHRSC